MSVGFPDLGLLHEHWVEGTVRRLGGRTFGVKDIQWVPTPHPRTGRPYVLVSLGSGYDAGRVHVDRGYRAFLGLNQLARRRGHSTTT